MEKNELYSQIIYQVWIELEKYTYKNKLNTVVINGIDVDNNKHIALVNMARGYTSFKSKELKLAMPLRKYLKFRHKYKMKVGYALFHKKSVDAEFLIDTVCNTYNCYNSVFDDIYDEYYAEQN